MTVRAARLIPAILAATCAAQSLAPPSAARTQPDARTEVDKIFARFGCAAGGGCATGPGCSAGVSLGGAQVLAAAYGMADLEHNVALNVQKRLRTQVGR
jgi:CubicO group peptidase (beta-lactamase class C family)